MGHDIEHLPTLQLTQLLQAVRQHCGLEPTQGPGDAKEAANNRDTEPRLRESLLQMLTATEAAYNAQDEARYQAGLHDILGVAGMYDKRLLEEMIREMKRHGFGLEASEAHHLFAEARTLIHKY